MGMEVAVESDPRLSGSSSSILVTVQDVTVVVMVVGY